MMEWFGEVSIYFSKVNNKSRADASELGNETIHTSPAALDGDVINVLGYYPIDDELYGIAWDKRSFISSTDQGATWMSVSHSRLTSVSAEASYVQAKDVPWVEDVDLQPATDPSATYVRGTWGGED